MGVTIFLNVAYVTVWESEGVAGSFFTKSQGVDDATSAFSQASKLGQPGRTPIYFAVDYDTEQPDVAGPITHYFQGVAAGLAASGAGNATYNVGV